MQAALLPDRGVVKVAGDVARRFLNGLVTADMAKVAPANPRFSALLTPQGKVIVEDLSEILGVMVVWDGTGDSEYGLSYPDPRLSSLGWRVMLPPHLASEAAADLGATLVGAEAYETHRIALG